MSATAPWFDLPQRGALVRTSSHTARSSDGPCVVVGAGLAGCSMAYALALKGQTVVVIDSASTIASGASSNPCGIVKPIVTREPSAAALFYEHAYGCLQSWLTHPCIKKNAAYENCGVLQLVQNSYPASKQYQQLDPIEATKKAGTAINARALFFENAGWLNPHAFCASLLEHNNIELRLNCRLQNLIPCEPGWQLDCLQANQQTTLRSSMVILANGTQLNKSPYTQALPLTLARGQISEFQLTQTVGREPERFKQSLSNHAMSNKPLANQALSNQPFSSQQLKDKQRLNCVVSGKRYAIPGKQSVYIGASFKRDDDTNDIKHDEHQENAEAVNDLLPELELTKQARRGFAGVRTTTPDRLPVCGPAPDFDFFQNAYTELRHGSKHKTFSPAKTHKHLYLLGGLGSRGIITAPYCAHLISEWLCTAADPIGIHTHRIQTLQSTMALLHPARFLIRELKRGSGL